MVDIGIPIFKDQNFSNKAFYNEPLFETKNFRVVPSLGSLVEGWLLIVPKNFYISFGAFQNLSLYTELNDLIAYLGQMTKTIYGDFVLFEHGPIVSNSLVGCSVDYAHLHLVPISIDLIKESKPFLIQDVTWRSVPGIYNTADYYQKNTPYLFIRDVNGNDIIGIAEDLPSQLFRKTIAKHIGVEEKYDWKRYPFVDNINSTIKSISSYEGLLNHQPSF